MFYVGNGMDPVRGLPWLDIHNLTWVDKGINSQTYLDGFLRAGLDTSHLGRTFIYIRERDSASVESEENNTWLAHP